VMPRKVGLGPRASFSEICELGISDFRGNVRGWTVHPPVDH
jgi:hypothetical protein